jgi:rhamnulokinase
LTTHLAVDIGAESGRAILGQADDGLLITEEIHRFPNTPLHLATGLHWDIQGLHQSVLEALEKASGRLGRPVDTVGIDTWGVDYGLLNNRGELIGQPYHYRDRRTEGMVEELCRLIPREEIYREAGLQFVAYNTLVQLLAHSRQHPSDLEQAERLLNTPDLLNYWLTGVKRSEYTMAATTQCLRAGTRDWAASLLEQAGIPKHLFGDLCEPGTVVGQAKDGVQVVAVASHDTASAAAAVPHEVDDFAWISSGTWSIVGVNQAAPLTGSEALAANVTNEGAADGSIRLCRNIMGLWLVQECRRVWREEGLDIDYTDLARLAESTPPGALFDPDLEAFLRPTNMPVAIRQACFDRGQPVPETLGEVVRAALESVAARTRWILDVLRALTGRKISAIHMVGGGTQNRLLCQLTANYCGQPVVAGPVEATAHGNLLVQMKAAGVSAAIHGEEPLLYEPRDQGLYQDRYQQFLKVIS